MLPFSNDTVTLYHRHKYTDDYNKTQTEWKRHIIEGCSWGGAKTKISIGDISIGSSDISVKLPISDDFTVQTGDIIINGVADDEVTDISALLNKYSGRVITVKTVRNNDGAGKRFAHIAVTGA